MQLVRGSLWQVQSLEMGVVSSKKLLPKENLMGIAT